MKVLFFSTARVAAGCESAEFAFDGEVSTDGLWQALIQRFPSLAPLRGSARLSCNEEYAEPDTRFRRADVVAVIPPVSGG